LAALSAELGEQIDEDELNTAFAQINTAQDGKIHFSEFINWWTKENRPKGTEKTGTKLAIIKSKLNAKFITKISHKMMRRLSELKFNPATKDSELVKYGIGFSSGDTSAPKSSAHLHVHFGRVDKTKLLGHSAAAEIVLPFKHGVSETVIAEESKKFIELFSKFPLPHKVNIDDKNNVARISITVPGAPDPFASAASLGIDLTEYVKELSLNLKFKHAIEDIINTNDTETTLADLVEFSSELKLQMRKALLHTIGQTIPGNQAEGVSYLALLENLNMSVALGPLKAFLSAFNPPVGVQTVPFAGLPPQYHHLQAPAQAFVKMAVDPKEKQTFKDLYLQTISSNEQGLDLLLSAKGFLEGVSQVNAFTESGMTLTLDLQNLIVFKLVPNKVEK